MNVNISIARTRTHSWPVLSAISSISHNLWWDLSDSIANWDTAEIESGIIEDFPVGLFWMSNRLDGLGSCTCALTFYVIDSMATTCVIGIDYVMGLILRCAWDLRKLELVQRPLTSRERLLSGRSLINFNQKFISKSKNRLLDVVSPHSKITKSNKFPLIRHANNNKTNPTSCQATVWTWFVCTLWSRPLRPNQLQHNAHSPFNAQNPTSLVNNRFFFVLLLLFAWLGHWKIELNPMDVSEPNHLPLTKPLPNKSNDSSPFQLSARVRYDLL